MKTQRHASTRSSVQVTHVIGRSVKNILRKGGSLGTGALSVNWPIKFI